MEQIERGDLVKCKITGYKGICVARTDWLWSGTRWLVKSQYPGKESEPASRGFDEHDLEIVAKRSVAPAPEADPRFKLGDELQDSVTGFKGVATGVTTWLNGCVRWTITSRQMHEGKPVADENFEDGRVVRVAETKEQPRRTGGDRPNPTIRDAF